MPDRIAMLGSLPPAAGISGYCLEIAEALSARAEVHFISFRHMYPKWLHPGGGVEDATWPEPTKPGLRIRRRLRWYNPAGWVREGLFTPGDVLHVQWWSWFLGPVYVTVMGMFRLRGRKIVVTVHNVRSHEHHALARGMSHMVLALADRFIVHTQRNVNVLRKTAGIAPERIHVIPHGVMRVLAHGAKGQGSARERLNLPAHAPTVLSFGAIRDYKGVDVLLDAAAQLVRDLPDLKVMIVGRLWGDWGKYQERIRRYGLEDHVFLHLDYVPAAAVADYFEAADLVVLPYRRFHAQSGVGMGALAFGKPLLVSDVGGLPDLLGDPRGALPPGDAQALARAMKRAFTESGLLERMRADALEQARKFQWDVIAQQTLDLYAELAGWKRGS